LEGYAFHVDLNWESQYLGRFPRGLGERAWVIHAGRRGWGCSDRFSPGDVAPFVASAPAGWRQSGIGQRLCKEGPLARVALLTCGHPPEPTRMVHELLVQPEGGIDMRFFGTVHPLLANQPEPLRRVPDEALSEITPGSFAAWAREVQSPARPLPAAGDHCLLPDGRAGRFVEMIDDDGAAMACVAI
jgi:hypothetical protein